MKLKLKQKELPPVQLRLVVPAALKEKLDHYLGFVHERSGREVDAREMAVEMLAQFIVSDREFRRWQRGDRPQAEADGVPPVQKRTQVNGHAAS
jgi:hypothetical protein